MSKRSVFCLRTCVLAAVLLVFTVGSSSAEGRYFRVVDGELVEFEPEGELDLRYFAWTLSGDAIQFDLSLPTEGEVYGRGGGVSAYIIQYERIAAVVGWDQLSASLCYGFYGIPICRGGSLSQSGRYLRLVDDEFIPIDLSGPHTGQFTDLLNGDHVEIEPAEPISLPSFLAALEPIAAVVGWDKLDCWIDHPYYIDGIRVYIGGGFRGNFRRGRHLRVVDGRFVTLDRIIDRRLVALDPPEPHTGHFIMFTLTGDYIEVDPEGSIPEQFEAFTTLASEVAVRGENRYFYIPLEDTGSVAVEAVTWREVKALFLR